MLTGRDERVKRFFERAGRDTTGEVRKETRTCRDSIITGSQERVVVHVQDARSVEEGLNGSLAEVEVRDRSRRGCDSNDVRCDAAREVVWRSEFSEYISQ